MHSLLFETFKAHTFLISFPPKRKKKEKRDHLLDSEEFSYCVTEKITHDDHSSVGFIICEYV